MTITFLLVLIVAGLVVIYYQPKLWVYLAISCIIFILAYHQVGSTINGFVYWLLVILYIALGVFWLFSPFRVRLLKPLFNKLQLVVPKISDTEALVLNAGDSWWEKELFQGKPDYNKLHALTKFQLSEEEQAFIDNETQQLCAMVDDWVITHQDHDLSHEVWDFIRTKGFFGLVIKKEYGGKGFSASCHSEIILKLGTRSSSVAVTVMVPNSLGPGELLEHYGTDKQKNYYLPRLARGEEIPCFALTGPTAGSDATSIPDLGIVCRGEYQGIEAIGIKLVNINKRYITLAPVATLVGLAFQLKDPDSLLAGVGREGITCALLPSNHSGMEIGNRLLPLDQAFMNGTIRIKESFIPLDWVIGGQTMCGEGWRMLVECLSIGRSISLPTCSTANAILSTLTSSAYSIVREQFKVPIASFEGIQEGLAKMAGLTYMMNATREFTVAAVDSGLKPSVASAISKYHLTESGRTVVNWAMDIHGGRGIIMGPHNYLATMYEAVPIAITVEGANIMTRNLMIFGQGAMRCHPYIRTIYESLHAKDGYLKFESTFRKYLAYLAQNKVRAITNGLTAGYFTRGYPSKFKNYYQAISRLSTAYSFIADLCLIILNENLKMRERLNARLGDVMSYLYMASASLKYYKDRGEIKADELYLKWVLEYTLYNAQDALIKVLENFPLRLVGKIYRYVLFPYGFPHHGPNDKLEADLAKELLSNGKVREDFKKHASLHLNLNDPVGSLELAYLRALAIKPLKNKISLAIKAKALPKGSIISNLDLALRQGIISQEEYDGIKETYQIINQVIQVDEFTPFELGPKNIS